MSARAIARQLTRDTARIFARLMPGEFMNLSWSRPSRQKNSPHLMQLIQRFNQTFSLAGGSILRATSFNDRALLYAKFVDVLVVRIVCDSVRESH